MAEADYTLAVITAIGVALLFALTASLGVTFRTRRRLRAETASLSDALAVTREQLRAASAASLQHMFDLDVPSGRSLVDGVEMPGGPADAVSAWLDRVHPNDREALAAAFRAHKAGLTATFTADYRCLDDQGRWRWMQTTSRIVSYTAAGSPQRLVGTHADVTDRKQSEVRAQRLASLYAALNECNDAALRARTDEELFGLACNAVTAHGAAAMCWIGRVEAGSPRVQPVVWRGLGSEYMRGLQVSVDPDDPLGRGPAGRALRSGQPVWLDDFQTNPDTAPWHERARECGWHSVAGLPLLRGGTSVAVLVLYGATRDAFDADARGMLVEFGRKIGFGLDRLWFEAQRTAAESALREKERLLSDSQRLAHVGSFTVDTSGRRLWSDESFRIYGLPVASEPPTTDQLLELVHPEDRARLRDAFAAGWRGEEFNVRYRVIRPDGDIRHLRARAELRHIEGRPVLAGVTQDVTEWQIDGARDRAPDNW